MHIRKGNFIRKITKNKVLILNLSLIILIFCAVFSRYNSKENNSDSSLAYLPLYNVETNKTVYSITIDLTGKENNNDVRLLSQVLKGMNVEATFFVTTDWIKKNEETVQTLHNDGHSFGMQILKDMGTKSRSNTINFLASENDIFYKGCAYYPSFVRINSENSGKIPELLNAFGQKYISASHFFSNDLKTIREGSIISINEVSSETPYEIAGFIGSCSEKGYKSIPLNDLIHIDNSKNENASEN